MQIFYIIILDKFNKQFDIELYLIKDYLQYINQISTCFAPSVSNVQEELGRRFRLVSSILKIYSLVIWFSWIAFSTVSLKSLQISSLFGTSAFVLRVYFLRHSPNLFPVWSAQYFDKRRDPQFIGRRWGASDSIHGWSYHWAKWDMGLTRFLIRWLAAR